jgi:hypothetical protein
VKRTRFLRQYRDRTLDEHVRLGSSKPVSYLPLAAIESVLQLKASDYVSLVERNGNRCMVFSPEKTCIKSGAAYAYCESALDELLAKHRDLLQSEKWPSSARAFVKRIASEWVEDDHPVLGVIREAFGEK